MAKGKKLIKMKAATSVKIKNKGLTRKQGKIENKTAHSKIIQEKKKKQPQKKEEKDEDEGDAFKVQLNPDFSFEFDGGDLPLDSLKTKPSTIDQIIARKTQLDPELESLASSSDEEDMQVDDSDDDEKDLEGSDSEDELENSDDDMILEDDMDEQHEDKEASGMDEDEEDASDDELEDTVRDKRAAEYFAPEVDTSLAENSMETFTDMRLSRPILKGISSMGFVKPTPIQANTIPVAMNGKDICGAAVTGSGKTAAFIIPILERLLFRAKNVAVTRVLILVPTRELASQCFGVAKSLAKYTDIQFSLLVGGLSSVSQQHEVHKRPDVVIATPGRLIDHIHNTASFNLDSVEILVLDEADRMLQDGFKAELNEIIRNCPKGRQTMLFSATMTDNVDDLIKLSLNRPVRLFINSAQSLTSKLTQEFIRIRCTTKEEAARKKAILVSLCTRTYTSECIIFFRSKADAHSMKVLFGLMGLKATELHGNLNQLERIEALELFSEKKVDFLLATDLASRGLDISGIKTVINYDMPNSYSIYVHRVGRTARAGQSGRAVSLVTEADRKTLKLAVKNAGPESQIKNRIIPTQIITKTLEKIQGMDSRIGDVYQEEKHEALLNKAEMEVNRASNLLEHRDEIMSRPKKQWFQSQADNKAQKELGKVIKSDITTKSSTSQQQKRSALDGLSRKKKRMRMLQMEDDKEELKKQSVAARCAKSSSKPKRLNTMVNGGDQKKNQKNKKGGKKDGFFKDEKHSSGIGKKKKRPSK